MDANDYFWCWRCRSIFYGPSCAPHPPRPCSSSPEIDVAEIDVASFVRRITLRDADGEFCGYEDLEALRALERPKN